MRVLVHAPAARMGGARTHLLGLMPELARLHPDDRYLLLAQPDLLADMLSLPGNVEARPERAQDRGLLGRLAWEQTALPHLAEAWRADVLLSFGSFVPLRRHLPAVLEAGNALFFTRAYWLWLQRERPAFQAAEVARWLLLQASLRASARVLVPTRAMRTDVVTRLPELLDRVDVALWGVSDHFRAAHWRPNQSRLILGVSKHGVNKEFDLLVLALDELRERWPDQPLRLALTGTPDESRWSRATAGLVDRLGLTPHVEWRGDVPNTQVPALIADAEVLVFPTWCESFGLPLAEGLAMGAPAVAADIPACREVGADAARYYRPGSAASLAEQLAAVLADPAEAAHLSQRALRRGTQFSWRANAEQVRNTLARAVRRPVPGVTPR